MLTMLTMVTCFRDMFPTETKQILEHRDEVLHCTWSNSGLFLATGALDGSLYIWKYNPAVSSNDYSPFCVIILHFV